MRAIVCGGREFDDADLMDLTLKELGVTFVIEGGARGADTLAWRWARHNLGKGSEYSVQFEARWDRDGRAAGPIRNQRMIDEGQPDAVVAFPGGRGTADMVRRAKRAGLPVHVI
ncbi:MAG: SLOG family protein [Pseudomonadota bacterium]